VPEKDVVQSAQHCPWIIRAGYDGLHCHLDHRGDQRGWHTVSGNVRHQESNALSVLGNELIEITSHRGHRPIGRRNPDVLNFRNGAGEDRELQLPGNLQFLFNRQQTTLTVKHVLHADISQRE
jgi:hypothetical protein